MKMEKEIGIRRRMNDVAGLVGCSRRETQQREGRRQRRKSKKVKLGGGMGAGGPRKI